MRVICTPMHNSLIAISKAIKVEIINKKKVKITKTTKSKNEKKHRKISVEATPKRDRYGGDKHVQNSGTTEP